MDFFDVLCMGFAGGVLGSMCMMGALYFYMKAGTAEYLAAIKVLEDKLEAKNKK